MSPSKGRVDVVYTYRPVRLEETGVTVQDVLVGVDVDSDEVLSIPAQSVPKLKAARERKDTVMSIRMPNELDDVLRLVADYYDRDSEIFSPMVVRYYINAAFESPAFVRRLGKLCRNRLAMGKREKSLRLRVRRDVHERLQALAIAVEGVNKSDLIRGAIVAAKEDVLEGRARKRREELGVLAQAV